MGKHIVWACAAAAIVSALAITTRDYNVEEIKQKAFMMKACVDAGGSWLPQDGWAVATLRVCKRPEKQP